jgi:hypothetical protein
VPGSVPATSAWPSPALSSATTDVIGDLPPESRPARARLRLVTRSCSQFARTISSHRCSSMCSRDAMDRGSGARRRETPPFPVQRGCRTRWTPGTVVDDGRLTHNPEVAGSNPAPATSFRRSGPFLGRERAFGVSGTAVKRVVATALRAARQRDGGDGVTRDETAWTWWTLPSAAAGRLVQR